jgi:sugar (glycoside-pentoside-hexuronide) transporter
MLRFYQAISSVRRRPDASRERRLSQAAPDRNTGPPIEDPRLTVGRKVVYASGDFTVNTVLTALNFFYVIYFLTQVAGLRPELAAAVQFLGRSVDALTDPAMGRLSDLCHWRWGRRRPFFLIGALPFGASFALLWLDIPTHSQLAMFLYYSLLYALLSISMTVVSVPYLALQPEMALGYDARTSLNTYRNAGSVLGVFAAVAFRPVAQALGGGPAGFAVAASIYGVALALPWLAVYGATWERPGFQARATDLSFAEGLRVLARHRTFRQLMGLYLCGRVSMDLVGAMLVLYFTYWIGRSEDFEITMTIFLTCLVISLPVWLRIARHLEKSTVFIVGSVWWLLAQMVILLAQPDWPRWAFFSFAGLAGVGYAAVDLMPWSMVGEVVDADDLVTGERREGIYNGVYMFLRKLAGTTVVAIALFALGALGFTRGEEQDPRALHGIRVLTSVVPAFFLALAIWIARGYPLTRAAHARIVSRLEARNGAR